VGLTQDPPVLSIDDSLESYKHIVYVHASWCSHCKTSDEEAAVLHRNGWKKRLKIFDYDKNVAFCEHFGVEKLPVYMLFENKKLVRHHYGVLNRWQVADFYNGKRL
jgi:thioredoxin-like negative regulator of GroEL